MHHGSDGLTEAVVLFTLGRGQHHRDARVRTWWELIEYLRGQIAYGGNVQAAQLVGETIAKRALEAGVKQVAFDRREYKYHGRVAAVADAARDAGLDLGAKKEVAAKEEAKPKKKKASAKKQKEFAGPAKPAAKKDKTPAKKEKGGKKGKKK